MLMLVGKGATNLNGGLAQGVPITMPKKLPGPRTKPLK